MKSDSNHGKCGVFYYLLKTPVRDGQRTQDTLVSWASQLRHSHRPSGMHLG